jgi:hypothetical protein
MVSSRGVATIESPQAPTQDEAPAPLAVPVPTIPAGRQATRWSEAERLPFRYGGQWYMDRAGSTYRWDGAASSWIVEPTASVPFFMRRPRFSPLSTPATVLYILFAVFMFATLLAIGGDIYQYATLDKVDRGEFVSVDDRDAASAIFDGMKLLQYLAVFGIAGLFLWWVRRATCNVPALGAALPEFSPGWAIGWWFIPFANWVQPGRVISQAWRASDASLPVDETPAWRRAKLSALVPVWWVGWLVGNNAWSITYSSIDESSMAAGDQATRTAVVLVLDIVMLAVAVLSVVLVASLTRRQAEANKRFDVAADGG